MNTCIRRTYGRFSKGSYALCARNTRHREARCVRIRETNAPRKRREKTNLKAGTPHAICPSFRNRNPNQVGYAEKERRADALALRAEERRDKLRKAPGRSKYPLIRGCLNGETRRSRPPSSIRQSITYGREPGELKHLSSRRKRKKHRFRE